MLRQKSKGDFTDISLQSHLIVNDFSEDNCLKGDYTMTLNNDERE